MTHFLRLLVVLGAFGVVVCGPGAGVDGSAWAQDSPPAGNVVPGPPPGGAPAPAPPPGGAAVPVVQKTYIVEWFFVPLLIVGALTAICRSSNRS